MFRNALAICSILFVGALLSQVAISKDLDEHWQDVGMDSDTFQKVINQTDCQKNLRTFLGCTLALGELSGSLKPAQVLVSKEYQKAFPKRFGKVTKSFGDLDLVEDKFKIPSGASIEKSIELGIRSRNNGVTYIDKLFEASGSSIDIDKIFEYIESKLDSASVSALYPKALNSYYGAIMDPHSYLMPIGYIMEQSQNSSSSTTGIGVSIQKVATGYLVRQVFKNAPAISAGVRARDVIIEVESEDVSKMPIEDFISKLTGQVGTEVEITVKRPDNSKKKIKVKRAKYTVANLEVDKVGDYGLIKLRSFIERTTGAQVGDAIKLLKQDSKGLIFDLRGNGGGLLTAAKEIVGHFVGGDKVVITGENWKTNKVIETIKTDSGAQKLTDLPVVILVDGNSASASEIVSGALQDYERAYVLGETTFGKGTAQGPVRWQHDFFRVLFYQTQMRFHLPSGRSNQLTGVVPDFEVPSTPNASAADRFFYREKFEFLPIPASKTVRAQGQGWLSKVSGVKSCVNGFAKAKKEFAKNSSSVANPDYQLFAAMDLLKCAK